MVADVYLLVKFAKAGAGDVERAEEDTAAAPAEA
jgi:hypothetical protein